MHDLTNCRFILDDDVTLKDIQMLELILLSYKDIKWVCEKSKVQLSILELNRNSKYFWVCCSNIYKSDTNYIPYEYLPLLDYKEIIKQY